MEEGQLSHGVLANAAFGRGPEGIADERETNK